MVSAGDGVTDLVSTLLSNSVDPVEGPLKWKVKVNEGQLPDITAEVTDRNSGDKRFYSIDMSRSMGVISLRTELAPKKEESEEERKARREAAMVAKEAPNAKTRKEAENVSRMK